MARAIMRLFPGVRLAFGPTTASGFYYDVEIDGRSLSEEDFPAIEAEMAQILKDAEPFERFSLPVDEARQFVADLGQTLKVEHIDDELHKFGVLSFYRQGEFVDLCRGPHIPHAGKVGAFKLLSIAGAYWKGQTDRKMLQRVYGTAFFDKKELDAHLAQLEEARKRDHRKLGKELGLFTISPLVGPGPDPLDAQGGHRPGHPRELHEDRADQARVSAGLHAAHRQDRALQVQRPLSLLQGLAVPDPQDARRRRGQGAARRPDRGHPRRRRPAHPAGAGGHPRAAAAARGRADGPKAGGQTKPYFEMSTAERIGYLEQTCEFEEYLLKPMNCPHHIQIYAAEPRSYRDLPLRLAEFGTVYRYEQSGELSGMTRVRGFTQDDAHLFCTHEQVRGEFRATMELTQFVLGSLGLSDYRVRLSKHDPNDPKYQGAAGDTWRRAEEDIQAVLDEMGQPYDEGPRRGRLLRSQGRLHRPRLHRPRVAARHRPARLRPARAVRAGVHRPGQSPPPARDDPPRPLRQHGAVPGHPHRALRRRLPALAGPRAGPRAAHLRQGGRLRPDAS